MRTPTRRMVPAGCPDDVDLLVAERLQEVAPPTVCGVCLGETTVVVEQRGIDVVVPCPGCACEFCGQTTDTAPVCLSCDAADDTAARRRADV